MKKHTWTELVRSALRSLPAEFTTQDAYSMAPALQRLRPENSNAKPKIRQQLQVLRDVGELMQPEEGKWKKVAP